jgi:hypothetical protein
MGDAIRPPAARAGVTFEVEGLEHEDGELVVSGHWSGLRGVRFVRPTLVVGDRQVLATLEHKPWTPRDDRAWIAAFPWTGRMPDAADLELAVAPSISVALGPRSDEEPEPRLALVRDPAPAAETAPPPDEPAPVPDPAPPPAPEPPEPPRRELAELRRELELTRDELARARTAAERDRVIAQAQRDEAVRDREAAVRTRARMELAYEEALAAQAAAEAAAELAIERAQAERDEAKAQRDEVLLAYRGLQRHVQSERASLDRAEQGDVAADADPEEPLGVRTLPAARTVMAELQRAAPASKFVVSTFDVWVVRVLGSVAAGCFILLLISIIRVFI